MVAQGFEHIQYQHSRTIPSYPGTQAQGAFSSWVGILICLMPLAMDLFCWRTVYVYIWVIFGPFLFPQEACKEKHCTKRF